MLNHILNNKKNFIYLLPFIFISLALISGPFLADLFCVIIGIIGINFLLKKTFTLKLNFLLFLSLFFYLLILTSSFLSQSILLSLESSLFYFRFFFYAYGISLILIKYEEISLKYFLIITFLSLILVSVTISYEFIVNLIFNNIRVSQFTGIFGSDKLVGSFTLRLYPLIIGLSLYFNRNNKYLIYIIVLIASFNIFFSGERTALLLFILQNILLFIFLSELRLKFLLIYSLSATFIILFSFLSSSDVLKRNTSDMFNSMYSDSNFTFFSHLNNGYLVGGKFTFFSKMHEGHYITALKIFNDHKIIGSGPKTFRILCSKDKYKVIVRGWYDRAGRPWTYKESNSCSTHPHNSYIQLLSETGIAGFFCLMIFVITLSYKLIIFSTKQKKTTKYNYIYITSIICILSNFFPFSPNGNFFNNWINVLYYLPIGFYIFANQKIVLNDNDNL